MPPSISEIRIRVSDVLSHNATHTAQVLSGPAAEEWLTAEARAALNWSVPSILQPGEHVVAEQTAFGGNCPDLLVYNQSTAGSLQDVAVVIDAKAVYPGYESQMSAPLDSLHQQLEVHASQRAAASASFAIHGLVFGVWLNFRAQGATYRMPRQFFEQVSDLLVARFPGPSYGSADQYVFHEILPRTPVLWPSAATTHIALAATTVTRL